MRNFLLAVGAFSLVIPAVAVPVSSADARTRHHYHRGTYNHHSCRHSAGTTGLVAGGVGGALVGRSIFGHGLLGTAAGGVGGAFAGRAIDRTMTAHRRCR
ncbi:MAG: hypothetical protein V4472_26025 [Pseudomonadota bacterium]